MGSTLFAIETFLYGLSAPQYVFPSVAEIGALCGKFHPRCINGDPLPVKPGD